MSATLNLLIRLGGTLIAAMGELCGDHERLVVGLSILSIGLLWDIRDELAARNKQEGSK